MYGKELFVEHVERLGFTGLPLEQYYQSIENGSVETVEVENYQRKFGDDKMIYNLAFGNNTQHKAPELLSFTATLRHVPTIEHDIYNGVDTKELESVLESLDWQDEQVPQDPQILGKQLRALPGLFDQFVRLRTCCSEDAIRAAHSLMTKYLCDSIAERYLNLAYVKKQFERTHNFQLKGEVDDIGLKDAYNLMSGRSVVKFHEHRQHVYVGHWVTLAPSEDGKKMELVQHPDFNTGEILHSLPLLEMRDGNRGMMLINSLIQGDSTQATLDINGKLMPVFLKANPAEHKIELLDEQGKPMPESIMQPDKRYGQEIQRKRNMPEKPGRKNGNSI